MAENNGVNADLPPPTFDLDSWVGNYDGVLLPLRLAHIATHCSSLARPSLALALDAAKAGKNTQVYTHLAELSEALGISDTVKWEQEWAARQEDSNRRELVKLETELRGYKNNLIRESIRMGQEELGTYLLLTGGPLSEEGGGSQIPSATGYAAAYQAYGKVREYCTTPLHVSGMILRLVFTAIVQAVASLQSGSSPGSNWSSVMVNAGRLLSAGVKEEEQSKLTPIASVTTGIAHLCLGQYSEAAASFMHTSFDYQHLGPVQGTDFPREVASANDIAIYGGLCALATLKRDVLIEDVLGGPFRQFLELEPQMRKAITLYTTAKYRACIDTLQHYRSDWSLDIFLGSEASAAGISHLDQLFRQIRERSITAYFSAFSQVGLSALAATFPPVGSAKHDIEAEVLAMIESGMLDARLDAVNGTLIALQKESRQAAQADAQKTAEDVERTLLLRLHRVNMVMAGLEIPRVKADGDGSRTGGGALFTGATA